MLKLYKPKLKDLYFRQALLSDPDTMSYNNAYGGIISFTKDKWETWYKRWINPSSENYFYRYLQKEDTNEFIGEIAYHLDSNKNIFICNIIILAKYRKQGFGTAGLNLLCNSAKENGINELYDDIAIDNPSISLFFKNGFNVEYQNDTVTLIKKIL